MDPYATMMLGDAATPEPAGGERSGAPSSWSVQAQNAPRPPVYQPPR